MTRKIIMCAAAAMVAGGVWAQKMTVDKVVAKVGNSSILYSEVVEAAEGLAENYRNAGMTSDRDLFYEAMEGLMERKLAYSQALIDSLTIDESMVVNNAADMLRAQTNEAGGIRELEKKNNMIFYDIRKDLEQQIREMAYAEAMQYDVMSPDKLKITPGEVELFFARFPADSIPTIPEQYMYAQITRFPATMKEAKERVREQLMAMREQVINGGSRFETLARLYSEDAGTALKGGELPPLTLEQMDVAFRNAVERLRPGQISEVVETETGQQIIQLTDKEGDTYRMRYIVLRPRYSDEELGAGALFLDSLAREIRAGSITFEDAARRYSDDAATRQNGGIATNVELLSLTQFQPSGTQMQFKFKKDDFQYNVRDYRELSSLKVGEVSDSFSTEDLKGNRMSKIVKLLAVYPTHEANLADDYLLLEEAALDAKREKAYFDWLDRTIDATNVYIAPEFRDPAKWKNKRWLK